MNQHKVKEPHYGIYSILEYDKDDTVKQSWLRIGVAFKNKDNSFNLVLRAMPVPDPQTGFVRMHMRLPSTPPETPQVLNTFDEPFQIFDIPLEDL